VRKSQVAETDITDYTRVKAQIARDRDTYFVHTLRRGADQIKVMAGGGVASPTDRLESVQYRPDELSAAVAEPEATRRRARAKTAR
jgi:imidazolonepropionase-like amidohydrolase